MNRTGFTLIEIIVAMAVSSIVLLFVTYFTIDISKFGLYIGDRLELEREAELALRSMVTEIRSIGPAANGAYPIEAASETTFTFYMDADGDGVFDRIRYFVDGTTLKRGLTAPTGSPATYPPTNEQIREVIHYVVPGTPIFEFFGQGYSGTEAALTSPVDIASIRLVKAHVTLDQDTTREPASITVSITATIRNLRGEI